MGFLILNGLLWLLQDCGLGEEKAELREVETALTVLSNEIDDLSQRADAESDGLKDLDGAIAACKAGVELLAPRARAGEGLVAYEFALADCERKIDSYNLRLAEFRNVVTAYDRALERHNALVPRANQLQEIVHSKVLLLPIPRGAGRTVRRAVR